MADPEPKQQGNTLRLRRPSGIIFDLGGTVMEGKSFNSLAGNTRLLEFAIDSKGITAQDIQRLANDIDCDVERIRDNCTAEFTWQNFQRLLFETLGISFSIGYERMEKEFRRASIVHIPEDGIFELLNLLDTHGIKRGIVSNTSFSGASLEEDLAAHKLANRFPFILSSSDYGFRKPSRRIFEVAIKKIGLERKDIWFVGNKLDTDIKGAIVPVFSPSGTTRRTRQTRGTNAWKSEAGGSSARGWRSYTRNERGRNCGMFWIEASPPPRSFTAFRMTKGAFGMTGERDQLSPCGAAPLQAASTLLCRSGDL